MYTGKKVLVVSGGIPSDFYVQEHIMANNQMKIQMSGGNTGNIIFYQSVIKEIGVKKCQANASWEISSDEDIDYINSNFSALVITFANAFRSGVEFINRLNTLLGEKIKIPICAVGIGAEDNLDLSIENDRKMIESLKKLTEQSIIGCRGFHTEEILNKHGITNTMTIGCPSMFSTLNGGFKIEHVNEQAYKIGLNADVWTDKRIFEPLLFTDMESVSYFSQYETSQMFTDEFIDSCPQLRTADIERREKVRQIMDQSVYSNIDVWMHELKKCRFSIGPRFHGNVLAILSGIPALFVAHCNRVNEMVDFFRFPHISVKEYLSTLESNNYELRVFEQYLDYSEFNKNYPTIYQNFKEFMKKNNLPFCG